MMDRVKPKSNGHSANSVDAGTELVLVNKSGPIPDERRMQAKKKFLDAMSRSNIITASADAAGVSADTIWHWRKENFITEAEIDTAYRRYCDYLRGEITKRAFIGVSKPALSSGRLVYGGEGQQVFINVVDNRLLEKLATKHLPEWKEASYLPSLGNEDTIPEPYRLVIDARDCTREELAILSKIAQQMEDRKQGIIDADTV
jgi:hypothetical protein